MSGLGVERTGTGNELQSTDATRAINGLVREVCLEIHGNRRHFELGRVAIRQVDGDEVTGHQRSQLEEHRRPLIRVDVSQDDRGPDLAR